MGFSMVSNFLNGLVYGCCARKDSIKVKSIGFDKGKLDSFVLPKEACLALKRSLDWVLIRVVWIRLADSMGLSNGLKPLLKRFDQHSNFLHFYGWDLSL